MIRSIELRNWKTHGHSVLEFQKGVNVLVGLMGAGKSSMMDAISFALFGTFPALEHRRVKISDIPTSRPAPLTDAEVKLVFDSGSDEYTVTRSIQKGKTSGAKLERNGEYLQTQPERVTEEVCSILKIGYDTFSRAVYAEQNRLEYFLELDKKSRKREIDEMLGLDHFASVEDNATSLINSMKSLVKEDEQMLEKVSAPSLKEKVAELEKELGKTDAESAAAKKDEGELSELSARTKKELEELKLLNARRMELSSKAEGLRGKSATLKIEIEKLDAMKIDEKELRKRHDEAAARDRKLTAELEEAKRAEQRAFKAVTATEERIRDLERRAKERDSLLKDTEGKDEKKLAASMEKEREELQRLVGEIASGKSRHAEVSEWLKELGKHLGRCPVCERELDDELRKKLLSGKEALARELETGVRSGLKAAKEKEGLIADLEKQVSTLQLSLKRLKDYENVSRELGEAKGRLEGEKKELEGAERAQKERSREGEESKGALREIKGMEEALERKNGYVKDKKDTHSALEKVTSELEGMKVDDKRIDALQSAFTEQSSRLSSARERRASLERYAESVGAQLAERRKELETYEGMERRISQRRERAKNLGKFKEAIVSTETALRTRLVTSINEMMAGLWPSLYPYGDYAGIKLNADNDDYSLEADVGLDGSSEWAQVNSVASGGERSVACLALRIAMAMVIVPNLRWLILDEPTHNIDGAGIGKLIAVFGTTLPDIVEQIFIITHDDSMKQISGARVFVLDRDKAANGPTIIGSA